MQLAVQGYVRRLSALLLETGQDIAPAAAAQLRQLEDEFCCLHAVKTRVSPKGWSHFYNWSSVPEQGSLEGWPLTMSQTDWHPFWVCFWWSSCGIAVMQTSTCKRRLYREYMGDDE